MTSPAADWQLDRLSTGAREAAEIASLGSGQSLSAWLTRVIAQTCGAEGVAPPSEPTRILEFTREPRERPALAAVAPAVAPAAPAPTPVAATPPAPIPMPMPMQIPMPRPAPLAAATVTPFRLPQPFAPIAVPPVAALPVAMPPVAAPPAVPAPVAVAPVAPPPVQPALVQPAFVQPALAQPGPEPVAPGAVMIAATSLSAANLGTRKGDDIPESLLADIATRGVRQPLLVRRADDHSGRFEIICGHRRWRAAQRVGLAQVPANIVSYDEPQSVLASLTENLQVGNLSPIEEAQAYLRLLTQCAIDASVVTAAIGRDRRHIVQTMRLLGLPPLVRHLIASGMLSPAHAYLLLEAPNPEALADAVLAEHLTVEATRQRIAGAAAPETKP